MGEVTAAEVLGWMMENARTPADAVDHFWPGLTSDERRTALGRIRQWTFRARQRGKPAPPKLASPYDTVPAAAHREALDAPTPPPPARPPIPAAPPPARPTTPANTSEVGERPAPPTPDMPRAEFLRAQLDNILFDQRVARHRNDHRAVSQLDARLSAVRAEYDKATELERRVVKVERTPAAICALLEERYEAIALRAELFRRRQAAAASADTESPETEQK